MKQTELTDRLKRAVIATLLTAKAVNKAVPAIAKKIQNDELRDIIQGDDKFEQSLRWNQEMADALGIKPKDLKFENPEGVVHGILCAIVERMKEMPRGGNEDLEVLAAFSRIAVITKLAATEQRNMAELLGHDDASGALDNIREEMETLAGDLEEMHASIISLDAEEAPAEDEDKSKSNGEEAEGD